MKYPDGDKNEQTGASLQAIRQSLKADCGSCFGFCCVALYFSASEGFPEDKAAGKPCINLQSDFRCSVHENLSELGLKGCTAYDCFGAGQKVAALTYGGRDWRQIPEAAEEMYEVFLIMRQIHEMLWYLTYALALQKDSQLKGEINALLKKTEDLTFLQPDALKNINLEEHRAEVNAILSKVSELVRGKYSKGKHIPSKRQKTLGRGLDLIGADLRKKDMKGENLRGAYLIAADLRGVDLSGADLIGADLRDADLRGANLTYSVFLTQLQLNSAKGDASTKLPVWLTQPMHWTK